MGEREPKQYAKEFSEIATLDDIAVVTREVPTTLVSDVGLFVLVNNVAEPSDEAKNFMEILTKAHLNVHYMLRTVAPILEEEGSKFALFVGKSPW